MPCCGVGDIAEALSDLWPTARIYALDVDAAMVRRWAERLPDATSCTLGDAEKWTPPAAATAYAVAGIDAFGAPYLFLRRFLELATWTAPALLVLTDGGGLSRDRAKRPFSFETFRFEHIDFETAQVQQREMDRVATDWGGIARASRLDRARRLPPPQENLVRRDPARRR